MSARNQMEVSDMRALSETNEFILVYPQETRLWGSTHWNVGLAVGSNAKDVEFIAALINQIADNYNIDDERVYAISYSNGGQFLFNELACQLSQKISQSASTQLGEFK